MIATEKQSVEWKFQVQSMKLLGQRQPRVMNGESLRLVTVWYPASTQLSSLR